MTRRRLLAASAAVAVLLAGCAAGSATAPPATTTGPSPSVAPATSSPVPTNPTATPSASTPFDGIWASEPLTRDDLAAALARRGIGDERLDEWFGDWDEIDYRVFEIEIGNGRWLQNENAEGVPFGGWAGDIVLADDDTIVARDDDARCEVTYDLRRDGDTLAVRVTADACPEEEDLPIQGAIYESSPFRLVQPAGWNPPTPAPRASESPPAAAPTSEVSTSSSRLAPRPIGTIKGAPRGYLEYLPPSYGTRASPLLVFLHGSGESGAGDEPSLAKLTATGIPLLIAQDLWPDGRPFVVLAPQHEEKHPSYCMEAAEIDAFLRFALKQYEVDPARVYLTGLSCGAIGLWNYLAAHGDEIVAAAVPIAGYGIGAVQLAGCDLGRVPIWAFHGSADDRVPVRGGVFPVTVLRTCANPAPVDVQLKVYRDQGHDVWTETYRAVLYDIYGWMLGHHK